MQYIFDAVFAHRMMREIYQNFQKLSRIGDEKLEERSKLLIVVCLHYDLAPKWCNLNWREKLILIADFCNVFNDLSVCHKFVLFAVVPIYFRPSHNGDPFKPSLFFKSLNLTLKGKKRIDEFVWFIQNGNAIFQYVCSHAVPTHKQIWQNCVAVIKSLCMCIWTALCVT